MVAKGFAHAHLLQRNVVIMTSLDIQGAFDAAWWPAILNNLRDFQCPRYLYNLARSYFSDRVAIMCDNTYRKERKVTKGCPQGSCCGPGFWYILYNALLSLEFTSHTKVIAFADDLVSPRVAPQAGQSTRWKPRARTRYLPSVVWAAEPQTIDPRGVSPKDFSFLHTGPSAHPTGVPGCDLFPRLANRTKANITRRKLNTESVDATRLLHRKPRTASSPRDLHKSN